MQRKGRKRKREKLRDKEKQAWGLRRVCVA
jgi:hypothetical protein